MNYCSPLYFANAEIFRQKVIKKVNPPPSLSLKVSRVLRNVWVRNFEQNFCLDRAGPWQTYLGPVEDLPEGEAEGQDERGREGQRDEKEEIKLFGQHEDSGGGISETRRKHAAHSQKHIKKHLL